MFKRYAVQTQSKLVRDNAETPTDPADPFTNVEVAAAYVELAKDLVTHAAFTIGGVYAACKIVERICK